MLLTIPSLRCEITFLRYGHEITKAIMKLTGDGVIILIAMKSFIIHWHIH